MSYFFKLIHKDSHRMVFITTEYLCEETTKSDLLQLGLTGFYKIYDYYKRWGISNISLYVSNNEFLYELTNEDYKIGSDMNKIINGKYFLIVFVNRRISPS